MQTAPASSHRTDELIIGIVSGIIVLAIAKSYRWLSDRLDAWGDKQAIGTLKTMEKDPALYADRALRKMRLCLCLAGYCFCWDVVLFALSSAFRPLTALFALISTVSCAIAAGYSNISTVEGVNQRIVRTRKRLKLPDTPQNIALSKTAP